MAEQIREADTDLNPKAEVVVVMPTTSLRNALEQLAPDIMRVDRRWGRIPRLIEGQRFLGDVARAVGRDRFLTFWTSAQPVDTALAAALKRPVGEWTADWERAFVPPIRLGPTPPLGGMAIALAIAALALAIVAGSASRRQVR